MTWNYFGLAGYDVYFITVNDTDIFASTWGNGLLRSSDGGSTWNMLGNGINTLYITTTFINGTDLFVCADDGLYFSNNYGSGFTQLNIGVSTGVNFLLINDSMLIAATYNGVFKSDDYGSTWSATPVFSGLNVWQVFNSGGILFAGTSGSGLYTSSDGGTSWTLVAGLPESYVNYMYFNNNVKYACTENGLYA